jgi:hypothetical protein
MMTCFAYRGPDLNSASPLEISALKHHTNRILSHHGDGFMISTDLIRHYSIDYPTGGAFPDPTTAVIDRERETHYTAEGKHPETSFALSFTYRPPPIIDRGLRGSLSQAAKGTRPTGSARSNISPKPPPSWSKP